VIDWEMELTVKSSTSGVTLWKKKRQTRYRNQGQGKQRDKWKDRPVKEKILSAKAENATTQILDCQGTNFSAAALLLSCFESAVGN
jgi:hypothetical protein